VIIFDEVIQGALEGSLAEQNQVIETFLLRAPDEPFGEGVEVGAPQRQAQQFHARRCDDVAKRRRKRSVTVRIEVLHLVDEAAGHRHIAGDLLHPVLVGIGGDLLNEPPMPAEQCIGRDQRCDFGQHGASERLGSGRQRGAFGIGEARPLLQSAPQDVVLCQKVSVALEKVFIDAAGDLADDACPVHDVPPFAADSRVEAGPRVQGSERGVQESRAARTGSPTSMAGIGPMCRRHYHNSQVALR
jgi:hypothetical protein